MNKVVNPLYKLLPSKKLNLGGKNGATDLHPMASDFFFEFKKIRISVSRSHGSNEETDFPWPSLSSFVPLFSILISTSKPETEFRAHPIQKKPSFSPTSRDYAKQKNRYNV